MFSIKVEVIAEEGAQLEHQRQELNRQIFELEGVIGNLSSLSGMEECISRLKVQMSEMNAEYSLFSQMTQILDKAVFYYINCENRLCDNADQKG